MLSRLLSAFFTFGLSEMSGTPHPSAIPEVECEYCHRMNHPAIVCVCKKN